MQAAAGKAKEQPAFQPETEDEHEALQQLPAAPAPPRPADDVHIAETGDYRIRSGLDMSYRAFAATIC